MLLNEILPSRILSDYIRLYRIIDFEFPDKLTIPEKIYPPRPEHCLQFFPTSTKIFYPESGEVILPKNASLVGQHTIINRRTIYRKFLSIQIVFQAGAIFQLFGLPATLITNRFLNAEDIIRRDAELINEQLFHAGSYEKMVCIIEHFLIKKLNKVKASIRPVDKIARLMLANHEQYSLDWFIKESCLSHRQFDRKFYERAGISPKAYLRIAKFDKAFRMKNKFPQKDWLAIAINCGYYDYQHLTKDYKAFTGYTPQQFFELDNKAPERIFGESEV